MVNANSIGSKSDTLT